LSPTQQWIKEWSSKENRGTVHVSTVSFGKIMMQALELLRLAKRHISRQATLNSEEIKPVALANIELRLS